MTKEEKRAKKKNDRGIVDFLMIQNHFFEDMRKWIEMTKRNLEEMITAGRG